MNYGAHRPYYSDYPHATAPTKTTPEGSKLMCSSDAAGQTD
jgi:hypothetical protein